MLKALVIAGTLLLQQNALAYDNDIYLDPPSGKSGSSVGLIMIGGAQITPVTYTPLLEWTQVWCSRPLYAAIPKYSGDMVEPLNINDGIKRTYSGLLRRGLDPSAPVFIAGHSLGGAMLQQWTAKHQFDYKKATGIPFFAGQILMGSSIQRKYRSSMTQLLDTASGYTIPTATIGGSLDGNCRITRIIEQSFIQNFDERNTAANAKNWPVLVVEGMSHMQFADGKPTPHVADYDLRPEISYDKAHNIVGNMIATFFAAQVSSDKSASAQLYTWVQDAIAFGRPYVTALQFESQYHLVKPCNCRKQVCKSNFASKPYCVGGSPFTAEIAQKTMSLLPSDCRVRMTVTDSFHPMSGLMPTPTSDIMNTCDSPLSSKCVLDAQTSSENAYVPLDGMDAGLRLNSAAEVRVKMSSRQNSWIHAGYSKPDLKQTDGVNNCAQINLETFKWAKARAKGSTLKRYNAYGQNLRFGADIEVLTGLDWINRELQLNDAVDARSGEQYVDVRSISLKSDVDAFRWAGIHDCKLLSPSRAMEWIYLDGLRLNYSIKTN